MATNKKAAAPAAEETLEPVEDVAEVDPWDEKVTMFVPRKPKGEEQQEYVCINDRRFTVPTDGKMHELPRPIAEILQQHIDAEAEADDFANEEIKVESVQPIATL